VKYVKYGLMGCGGVTLAFVVLALVVAVVSAIAGGDDETTATGGGDMPPTVPTTIEVEVVAIETTTTQAPTTTRATTTTTTTTTQAPTTTTTFEFSEDDYEWMFASVVRNMMEDDWPDFWAVSDDMIIDLGYEMCNVIDFAKSDEQSPEETMLDMALMVMEGEDPAYWADLSGAVLGAAPPAFCPEHEDYAWDMIMFAADF
jgi:hypothetical protein